MSRAVPLGHDLLSCGPRRLRGLSAVGLLWRRWRSPRVWKQLPAGTLKIAIGRQKRDAADAVDDIPLGWLLEFFDR